MRDDITPIGVTNFRNTNRPFGIKDHDRFGHVYIIGKTGVGKSTLIKNMALSDIVRGNGVCVIDPHGDLVTEILPHIPEKRTTDLVYLNPQDAKCKFRINPLKDIPIEYHHLVASSLVTIFKKMWFDSWGPRLEYIMRYSVLTLLWFPNTSLLDIQPLLTSKEFRMNVLSHVRDPNILAFWEDEFEKYTPKLRSEAVSAVVNKAGVFNSSLPLRRLFGASEKCLKFQPILNGKKIFLVNLSKGEIGEDACILIGSVLVNSLQLAATYRARMPESARVPFFAYVDECHSFISLAIATILSEARKYRLSLCLANQYLSQLPEPIQKAIFGNVGTLISFRVGADDADLLQREFAPVFHAVDLINLPRFSMYLKLMIDGVTSQPFSATTGSSVMRAFGG